MMKMIFAGLMMATVAACSTMSPAPTQADTQAEFAAYNARYNEIVQSYDMDAFIGLYADNPLWIDPKTVPIPGLDVPRAALQALTDNAGVLSHSVEHVFVSSDGSQAVLIGRYDAVIEKFDAKSTGTYLFVLKRDGDAWKIVADMFNEHKK